MPLIAMVVDVMPRQEAPECYLGDGLYASFDGFQIKLRTTRGDGDHEVYLEPSVYKALEDFARKLWE
jgi:hypothetical protein